MLSKYQMDFRTSTYGAIRFVRHNIRIESTLSKKLQIGNKGAEAIAEALKVNNTLSALGLRATGLTYFAIDKISQV